MALPLHYMEKYFSLHFLSVVAISFTSSVLVHKWTKNSHILAKYATLAELLPLAYPEHEWQHWRLQTPLRPLYWKNKEYQKKFLWWLGLKLGIKTWSDWYSLTKRQVKDHGGAYLLLNAHLPTIHVDWLCYLTLTSALWLIITQTFYVQEWAYSLFIMTPFKTLLWACFRTRVGFHGILLTIQMQIGGDTRDTNAIL